MDIKIGADEIILWLRKNGKAKDILNPGTGGLGLKIYELICKYNGRKVQDSYPSYWPIILKDDHIGEYELPQTSAQYIIDNNNLPKLFSDLNKW
jgi:hypothetical protein